MIEEERWKDSVFCLYRKSKEVVKNEQDISGGIKVKRVQIQPVLSEFLNITEM